MEDRIISESSEWTFDDIQAYEDVIGEIAKDFCLDTYPNQIEIISSEQMIDAYSSVGMPINYQHWSFGKQFVSVEQSYQRGQMGLAYEIVINSDPCISYLMEENTMMMQILVIAHAAFGHNSFFKGNYLFNTWTNADAIVDYLLYAKNFINDCEERYGETEVELVLDSCHALMNFGVDKYKRPPERSARDKAQKQQEREAYLQSIVNDLWRTLPVREQVEHELRESRFPEEPQENILYFIEKNAPVLEDWKREIIRIVRKMAQYFYPQRQTQVMNEGWASFWHYTLVNELYDRRYINDGFIIEFLQSHTNVVYQPTYDSPYYSGINPYALGFNMWQDIKRMCTEPTEEDKYWFPHLVGKDWRETMEFAMQNFKDESFIVQYLSPRLMRDFRLFSVLDDDAEETMEISAIHNEAGYHRIRNTLSDHYNLGNREPDIQVYNVDVLGDRSLTLRHFKKNRVPLNRDTHEVMKHVARLWGFDVRLESESDDGRVELVAEVPHSSR